MLLPSGKVANMPAAAHVSHPRFGCVHHRIIQADWEECGSLLLILLLTRSHHFPFYPSTLNSMFGENENELVVETNRFINALMVVITDFQIFGGEPAAHTLVLQVYVKSPYKVFIFSRVTNEACKVINSPN